MTKDDIILLYKYNYWANQQIVAQAAKLSTEDLFAANDLSWGSIGGTLIHTMDAEYGWRTLLQTGGATEVWGVDDFDDLDAIIKQWDSEEKEMWTYLDSLTDEKLNSVYHYSGEGYSRSRVLWHCLVHVVNHGTQHRSECALKLTNGGHSPGEIDFTMYLNDFPAE